MFTCGRENVWELDGRSFEGTLSRIWAESEQKKYIWNWKKSCQKSLQEGQNKSVTWLQTCKILSERKSEDIWSPLGMSVTTKLADLLCFQRKVVIHLEIWSKIQQISPTPTPPTLFLVAIYDLDFALASPRWRWWLVLTLGTLVTSKFYSKCKTSTLIMHESHFFISNFVFRKSWNKILSNESCSINVRWNFIPVVLIMYQYEK